MLKGFDAYGYRRAELMPVGTPSYAFALIAGLRPVLRTPPLAARL